MPDIVEIIHEITYNVQDNELRQAANSIDRDLRAIENLTKRQIRLAQAYDKTGAKDEQRRKRLNKLIQQNAQAMRKYDNSLEDSILNNKQLNKVMQQEFGIIGTLERKLKILEQRRRSATSDKELGRYNRAIEETRGKINRTSTVGVSKRGIGVPGIGVAARLLPAVGGAFALSELSQNVATVTKRFEGYRTVFKNTYQDSSRAAREFDKIKDFAAKTPFSVDALTASFIKLVNRGFTPTKDELTKIGDLAASQGKSFDQLTEAILDAQTGEFERLKEFGIRAKTVGDQVTLSFKGVEKQVKKTDEEALRQAVISFGALQGVAGGMAAASQTLDGKLSNLGDTFDTLFENIGQKGLGVMGDLITATEDLVSWFVEVTETNPVDALREQQDEINGLVIAIISANEQEEIRSNLISELNQKYPEILSNIDIEKATNEQLWGVLRGVNDEYEKKIRLTARERTISKIADEEEERRVEYLEGVKRNSQFIDQAKQQGLITQEEAEVIAETGKINKEIQQRLIKAKNENEQYYREFTGESGGFQRKGYNEKGQAAINLVNSFTNGEILELRNEYESKSEELENEIKNFNEYKTKLSQEQIDYINELKNKIEASEVGSKERERLEGELKYLEGRNKPKKTTTPTTKPTTTRTTSTRKGKTKVDILNEAEKIDIERQKQRFEQSRNVIEKSYENREILKETYDDRIERLTKEHNSKILEIERTYGQKRINLLKESEKEVQQTRLYQIENGLVNIQQSIKDQAEKTIEELVKFNAELDDELIKIRQKDEQVEISLVQSDYQKQIDELEEQLTEIERIQLEGIDSLSEEELELLEERQNKLKDKRLQLVENEEREIREIRRKYAFKQIDDAEEAALNQLDSYTNSQLDSFNDEYNPELEQNNAELERLKAIQDEKINLEEYGKRKRLQIEQERAERSEEIQKRHALASLYINKQALKQRIEQVKNGLENLTGEELKQQENLLSKLIAELSGTNDSIKNAFENLDNPDDSPVPDWINQYDQLADAALNASQTIVSAFSQSAEREIEIREKRVDRVKEIADRGNAEVLQQEEEKLQKAVAIKERYARREMDINAVQQASAAALAVAKAAASGGGIFSLPAILATIAALATGFSLVNQLTQDNTPAFKDGVVNLHGPGTGTSDSIPARLSKGESVVTAKATQTAENADILKLMNDGTGFYLPKTNIESKKQNHGTQKEFYELKSEIIALKTVMENQKPSTVTIDEEGIATISQAIKIRNRKRDKL